MDIECPKYEYPVYIWFINSMQSSFHFYFIVMTDLSVVGIGLKFRHTLKMLIIFLCNCLTTSANSCLHKKTLALTFIKESFSSFVKLWNPSEFFDDLCKAWKFYPRKCLRHRRLIFLKNRGYDTDISIKHIEEIMSCNECRCPYKAADTVNQTTWLDCKEVSARRIKELAGPEGQIDLINVYFSLHKCMSYFPS